jgi:hypothetical protein
MFQEAYQAVVVDDIKSEIANNEEEKGTDLSKPVAILPPPSSSTPNPSIDKLSIS